jgi:hypothetical protein
MRRWLQPYVLSIDSKVFDKLGLILLGVNSKGEVKQVYPTYAA